MNDQRITLSDIDIPFTRLVAIFVKWGIAAIPAAIIISVIMSLIFSLMFGLLGFGSMHMPTTHL
ncbi:MAG: hypothetical protein KGL46_04165 [Hyphomicrobiales bacterium]|nr:hypothetical protein [Hyphomicrobiales bacterium]